MKKHDMYISEERLTLILTEFKLNNNASMYFLAEKLKLSRTTIYRAIVELKRRGWIKPKAERVGNVVVYQIVKKD